MAKITMRPPRQSDIAALVANLRPLDRQELEASHGGDDLHEAVRRALNISSPRWAMDVDEELGFVMGLAPVSLMGGIGSPWLLGTNALDRVPGALTRTVMQYCDIMLGISPILINYVDARNVKSIRWLKVLGFTVSDQPTPYGPRKMPFYKFEMRA